MRTAYSIVGGLVLLCLVAGIIFVGHQAATMPAEMSVVDERCENGNITQLTVAVEFSGDDPVTATPHVWDGQQHVQHPWSPERVQLTPGVQILNLTAPSDRATIKNRDAQVYLAADQERVIENFRTSVCQKEQ